MTVGNPACEHAAEGFKYSASSHPPPPAPNTPVHHAVAVPLALFFCLTAHWNTAVSLNAAGVSLSKYYLSKAISCHEMSRVMAPCQHARTQILSPKHRNRQEP